MSILIKGMEMPRDCGHCPFVFFDGQVNEHSWCEAIKPYGINVDKCYETERHKDCPLILVPPHGRLIDADALLQHQWVSSDWNCGGVHEIVVSITDIDDAPTIIEAEGE